ncbi:MAG: T9SS type A sorting domain-containing protein [Bacteroidetes bacterium]|nr:T9SS type A sorting domain-containing protein [Bacteroidota bacterium]
MKFFQQVVFTLATTLTTLNVFGQANPFINVLPSNSGIVTIGGTIDIIVTIGNAGPISTIPQAKLRPIIQVPASVTFLPTASQVGLPTGWTILSNTGSQIRICNSTDPIPVSTSRIIILKAQGVTVTPPQTFSGNINFGNGTTCAAGTSVSGDLPTDNSALSTIEVIAGAPLPLILNNFSVKSDNCIAHLNWSTSSETNSEKFEIEKSETNHVKWKTIGSVIAQGNSSTNSTYYFKDENIIINNKVVMYRLKMIDIDGSFMYSPVVDALLKCDEQNLSVFPNPVANGKLNVSLYSAENVEANLTSVTGQQIKKIILKNGINNIDVSELSNGVYILSTKFAHGINQNVKINIQK